jgi:hypothetical protein
MEASPALGHLLLETPNIAESNIVRSPSYCSSLFAYHRQIIVALVLQGWAALSALGFCVAQAARLDNSNVPKRISGSVDSKRYRSSQHNCLSSIAILNPSIESRNLPKLYLILLNVLVIVWLIRISNTESLSTSKLNIKSQTSTVLGLFHINSVAAGHDYQPVGKLDFCYQGVDRSIPSSKHSALVLPGL